jgi:hypothetical protein
MNNRKTPLVAIWLLAIVLLVGLGGGYAVAYFGLSTTRITVTGQKCREYRSFTIALLFIPASLVESAITGDIVSPACPTTAAGAS